MMNVTFISILIIAVFYLHSRMHTHTLKIAVAKQRIEITRFTLTKLFYNNNLTAYTSLYGLIRNTKETMDLTTDAYIDLFVRPNTQRKNGHPHNDLSKDLTRIVSSQHASDHELLLSFIALQLNLLLIKNPFIFYKISLAQYLRARITKDENENAKTLHMIQLLTAENVTLNYA